VSAALDCGQRYLVHVGVIDHHDPGVPFAPGIRFAIRGIDVVLHEVDRELLARLALHDDRGLAPVHAEDAGGTVAELGLVDASASQEGGCIVVRGAEGRGGIVLIRDRLQCRGIPVDKHALVRKAEYQALVAEAVLARDLAAMLVAVIAGQIASGCQVVRHAVVTRDRDVALPLRKRAADHLVGVVRAGRVDVAACFGPVGMRKRRR
jgi:hypothetical protein